VCVCEREREERERALLSVTSVYRSITSSCLLTHTLQIFHYFIDNVYYSLFELITTYLLEGKFSWRTVYFGCDLTHLYCYCLGVKNEVIRRLHRLSEPVIPLEMEYVPDVACVLNVFNTICTCTVLLNLFY